MSEEIEILSDTLEYGQVLMIFLRTEFDLFSFPYSRFENFPDEHFVQFQYKKKYFTIPYSEIVDFQYSIWTP